MGYENKEGFKEFIRRWYANASIHEIRQKLQQVEWKGSGDQLQRDIQDVAGSCSELTDKELIDILVGTLPDDLGAMWASHRRQFTTWQQATAYLKNAEYDLREVERARKYKANRYTSASNVISVVDREKRDQRVHKGLNPRDGPRRLDGHGHKASEGLRPLPKNLSACRNCGGMGHLSQTCANLKGSKAQSDVRCFRCQGRGHVAHDCTNQLFEQLKGNQHSKGCPTTGHKRPSKPSDSTNSMARARLNAVRGRGTDASRRRYSRPLGSYDAGEDWVVNGGLIGGLRKPPSSGEAHAPKDELTQETAARQPDQQRSTIATVVGKPPMMGTQASANKDMLAQVCNKSPDTVDYHPLVYLSLTVNGKPSQALIDIGSTHTFISTDYADELQLQLHKLPEPVQGTLGKGQDWRVEWSVEGLRCRAGELYFKLNALVAPVPFQLILGQPFFAKERLTWKFSPQVLGGWRRGRWLALPLLPSGKKADHTGVIHERDLWDTRVRAQEEHKAFLTQLEQLTTDEALARVRPSPKRYKNFRTAGARAHVRHLVQLARADQRAKVLAVFAGEEAPPVTESETAHLVAVTPLTRQVSGKNPEISHKEDDATIPPDVLAVEGEYFNIPKQLNFEAWRDFIPTYNKFDAAVARL
ncbi:hypothetical protein Emed_007503 [Eimeria media]